MTNHEDLEKLRTERIKKIIERAKRLIEDMLKRPDRYRGMFGGG